MPNMPIERLSLLMIETVRIIRGRLHGPQGDACVLSQLQLSALLHVNESETPPLMKDVAVRLRITPSTATPIIENLVASGWLRRQADRRDRRAIRIAITPKGRRVLSSARRAHVEKMRAILSVLDEDDRESLSRILGRIAEKFQNRNSA